MNTAFVELKFTNGSIIVIDTIAAENSYRQYVSMVRVELIDF